jgi:hypothetical protein
MYRLGLMANEFWVQICYIYKDLLVHILNQKKEHYNEKKCNYYWRRR